MTDPQRPVVCIWSAWFPAHADFNAGTAGWLALLEQSIASFHVAFPAGATFVVRTDNPLVLERSGVIRGLEARGINVHLVPLPELPLLGSTPVSRRVARLWRKVAFDSVNLGGPETAVLFIDHDLVYVAPADADTLLRRFVRGDDPASAVITQEPARDGSLHGNFDPFLVNLFAPAPPPTMNSGLFGVRSAVAGDMPSLMRRAFVWWLANVPQESWSYFDEQGLHALMLALGVARRRDAGPEGTALAAWAEVRASLAGLAEAPGDAVVGARASGTAPLSNWDVSGLLVLPEAEYGIVTEGGNLHGRDAAHFVTAQGARPNPGYSAHARAIAEHTGLPLGENRIRASLTPVGSSFDGVEPPGWVEICGIRRTTPRAFLTSAQERWARRLERFPALSEEFALALVRGCFDADHPVDPLPAVTAVGLEAAEWDDAVAWNAALRTLETLAGLADRAVAGLDGPARVLAADHWRQTCWAAHGTVELAGRLVARLRGRRATTRRTRLKRDVAVRMIVSDLTLIDVAERLRGLIANGQLEESAVGTFRGALGLIEEAARPFLSRGSTASPLAAAAEVRLGAAARRLHLVVGRAWQKAEIPARPGQGLTPGETLLPRSGNLFGRSTSRTDAGKAASEPVTPQLREFTLPPAGWRLPLAPLPGDLGGWLRRFLDDTRMQRNDSPRYARLAIPAPLRALVTGRSPGGSASTVAGAPPSPVPATGTATARDVLTSRLLRSGARMPEMAAYFAAIAAGADDLSQLCAALEGVLEMGGDAPLTAAAGVDVPAMVATSLAAAEWVTEVRLSLPREAPLVLAPACDGAPGDLARARIRICRREAEGTAHSSTGARVGRRPQSPTAPRESELRRSTGGRSSPGSTPETHRTI